MMPLHRENSAKKLTLLKLIKQKKAVIFGSIKNNTLSKKERQEAWEEILRKAQSLGLATTNRNWCYARDHIFGQWKSRTLAKYENAKKTGAIQGRETVLNDVDKMILDIVQNDYETSERSEKLQQSNVDESQFNSCSSLDLDDLKPNIPIPLSICIKEDIQQKSSSSSLSISTEEDDLHFESNIKRKMLIKDDCLVSLKKKVLESKLYKNKLQILKLERELNLSSSKFSNEFQSDIVRKRRRLLSN